MFSFGNRIQTKFLVSTVPVGSYHEPNMLKTENVTHRSRLDCCSRSFQKIRAAEKLFSPSKSSEALPRGILFLVPNGYEFNFQSAVDTSVV